MSRTYEQLEPVISALDDRIKTNLGAFPTDTAEGSIASFADGADDIPLKSLVVDINPVQDLHGYDNPWVAGGGTNKWDEQWELGSLNSNTGLPVDSTTLIRSKNFCECLPSTSYAKVCAPTGYVNVFWYDEMQTFISLSSGGGSDSYSVVTSPSNAKYFKIRTESSYGTTYKNDIAINYPSTITTYSPYENICPISGWTGANVVKTGKNLWDKVNGGILNGYIGSTDIVDSASRKTAYIRCAPNTTYTVSKTRSIATDRFYVAYTKDITAPIVGTAIFGTVNAPNSGTVGTQTSCSITTGTDAKWLVCWFSWDASVQTDDINSLQFELGSSASSYESFNGQTIPIDWQTEAGTVYGGHLDVLSGVLTVDRYFIDPSQWTQYGASNGYTAYQIRNLPEGRYGVENYAKNKPLSNIIAKFGSFSSSTMNKNIIQPPRTNSNVAYMALQDGIDPTTVELSYLTARLITIQLTPHDVKTLLGQNNIFADTGDTEVEYRADTKLYIERLTEPDADMIADSNIVSGQYFMVGNTLYKATANIASGSAVIEGTNCTQKSLSEALNEINQ